MGKFNKIVILTLTAAILLFCAGLPWLYSGMQTFMTDNKVGYEDMKTISFDKNLSIIDKMFLLRDGIQIPTESYNTFLVQEDVEAIIYQELEYYKTQEIILKELGGLYMETSPVLVFDNVKQKTSHYFWLIHAHTDNYEEIINMWLDDETGMILQFSYESADPLFEKDEWMDILQRFAFGYLERLTLLDVNENGDGNELNSDYLQGNMAYDKKNGIETYYTIGDSVYGELQLHFYSYSNGFYVEIN